MISLVLNFKEQQYWYLKKVWVNKRSESAFEIFNHKSSFGQKKTYVGDVSFESWFNFTPSNFRNDAKLKGFHGFIKIWLKNSTLRKIIIKS